VDVAGTQQPTSIPFLEVPIADSAVEELSARVGPAAFRW
jgi:hypothetical protein